MTCRYMYLITQRIVGVVFVKFVRHGGPALGKAFWSPDKSRCRRTDSFCPHRRSSDGKLSSRTELFLFLVLCIIRYVAVELCQGCGEGFFWWAFTGCEVQPGVSVMAGRDGGIMSAGFEGEKNPTIHVCGAPVTR